MDMILNGEPSLDQVANSGTSPQIRREPSALRAFEQAPLELPFLTGGQFGRSAGSWPSFDSVLTALQKTRLPAADGATVHFHSLGDVYGRKSLLKQCDGLETTVLELRWAAEWSHAQMIGHYLGEYQ
jgi:hypothetical protein